MNDQTTHVSFVDLRSLTVERFESVLPMPHERATPYRRGIPVTVNLPVSQSDL